MKNKAITGDLSNDNIKLRLYMKLACSYDRLDEMPKELNYFKYELSNLN